MRTKFYLLLIALVTSVCSVWGQVVSIGGVRYEKDGTTALVVGKYEPGIVAENGIVTILKEVLFTGDTEPTPVVGTRGVCFRWTDPVKEVTILADLKRMDPYMFYGCGNLEKVTIEGAVEVFGLYAFGLCVKLTSIVIPEGVTVLHHQSFGRNGLTGTVSISSTVEFLEQSVFGGSLIEAFDVDINNQHYKAVDGVIFSKDGKTLVAYPAGKGSSYTIPSGVEIIGDGAFQYNTTLTEIIIPEGVTHIGPAAFHTTSLTSVLLPESLENIGVQAFADCALLIEVSIPANVNKIDNSAFRNNTSLETVIFNGETIPEFGVDIAPFIGCDNLEFIYVPSNSDDYDDLDPSTDLGITGITPQVVSGITVDFDSNGGNLNIPQKVFNTATAVKEPAVPSRAGFIFSGWYNNGTKWSFSQLVTASMTLTAEWNEILLAPVVPTYTITITPLAGVSVNKPEGGTVNEGRSFSFTTTANANGYRVIVYVNGKEHAPTSDNFYLIEGITEDKTVTFALTAGTSNDDSIVGGITINGEPLDDKKTDFPEEGKIVITFNDDADTSVSGKVIIDGKEVSGTWGTDSNGNPTYTIDYAVTGDGEHTIKIEGFGGDGETHTFTTGGGSGNNTSGGKVVIDDTTPPVIPGEFPGDGEIVVYPPVVAPGTTPEVIIDGEKVVPGGTWGTDDDGKPIFEIEYEGLEDGEYTIVVNGKEYTFTVKNGGGATSNDVLSTAKITAAYGTVTIETPSAAIVQVVSLSGSVVYNANVTGTVTVNVPAGIYVVVVDGVSTKIVVR
jgi:Listeria/Bacterioides repeat